MFSPSLPSETSVALTARYRQLLRPRLTSLRCSRHPETSLGKMNILVSIPAISTTLVLPSLWKVGTSVCCVTSSDLIASVYGFCSSVQTPQSGLLHCMPHGKPACHLLGFGTLPPRLKGLSPVGTVNFLTYIHHSRHTQAFGSMAGEVVN
ncbi:hypothetical protein Belba_2969 [Belliella baltica DSM 15883]|uniref:Uncharacterized protein n=1 Tax=Belliella baltica (strain DSM 15883 / CIP 108006 / LMG 21964 / BA134) TaxID=866536 RepID=I3Z8C6_BELBD|nr:hypothetical protein Belba_2969 [Belliella baltica DSM 15883]